MLTSHSITVEEAGNSASKRSRVDAYTKDARYISRSPPRLVVEATCTDLCSFQHHGAISENTVVCFGMLLDCPVVAAPKITTLPAVTVAPVILTSASCLNHAVTGELLGKLLGHTGDIVSRLVDDTELAYQLTLRRDAIAVVRDPKLAKGLVGYLGVIIYGPRHRLEDIGDFMTQCGCFLEDPVGCDRDVPYMNPQCLFSIHETPVNTFSLSRAPQVSVEDFTQACSDILDGFETTDPLHETPTPAILRTHLQSHQKQALTFLLRREQGLHPNEDSVGLWAPRTDGLGFSNIVTNQTAPDPGPIWRGGLLADEMGLGKTLSMIALIASDHAHGNRNSSSLGLHSTNELWSTLVVLPLSLIPVWLSQLDSHVHHERLTSFVHHGKNRLQISNNMVPPNIVFTTYQVIEYEQRKRPRAPGSLFTHSWRRIILDEAHIIRNHGTSTARAIAALNARTRWAISGTPVQNSLLDFLGLFKFLHFAPYDNPKVFDEQISQLWRDKPVDEAVQTFRKLLSCVMLRRTKGILELPAKTDKILYVSFNEQEEKHYRRIELPVVELLDQPHGTSWANKIQQINKLRLICNLGIYLPRHASLHEPVALDGSLQATLGARLSTGESMCAQCLGPVSLPSSDDRLGRATSSNTYYSTCGLMFCAACTQLLDFKSPSPCECLNGSTPCSLLPLSCSIRTPQLTPTRDISPSIDYVCDDVKISSKIRALIEQIKSCPTEKNAVFSFWTSSLDMVERGLAAEEIGSVRIDGSVATGNRAQAIANLRDDPTVRVILLTTSCGACGLDLTAASRVHLLEPQWNPSQEDQALARVHRLGQTRPVTTIRYIVRDSFEEDILQVQDRKKLLATTLLSDSSAFKNLQKLLREKRDQTN